MTDYGYSIRQKFIAESTGLDAKRAAIRQRWHADGKYFVGEESLAKLNGGKMFDRVTGWKK